MLAVQSTPLTSLSFTRISSTNSSLITIARDLLSFLIFIKTPSNSKDILDVKDVLIKKITEFSQQSNAANYSPQLVAAAKYCLCAALDEAVMSSQWGNQKDSWDQTSLLSYFFKETFGGEKFFIILRTVLEQSQANIVLLELLYILLTLDFKGQYYNRDPFILQAIKQDLLQKISPYLSFNKKFLQGPFSYSSLPKRSLPFPLWTLLPLVICLLLAITFLFSYQLKVTLDPIFHRLSIITSTLEQENPKDLLHEKIP